MATFTENFTGSAGNLTSPWTSQSSLPAIAKNGSGLGGGSNSGSGNAMYYNDTFGNDQYAQCKITGNDSGSPYTSIGVILRGSGTDWYIVRAHRLLTSVLVDHYDGGSFTNITSSVYTLHAGDTLYAKIEGKVITVKDGGPSGTTILTHDTTGGVEIASGKPGIYAYANGAYMDDVEVGDIGGGGGGLSIPVAMAYYRQRGNG